MEQENTRISQTSILILWIAHGLLLLFEMNASPLEDNFRLQPQKDNTGNWTKELIYINEFQKHGYIKRAKVLSN